MTGFVPTFKCPHCGESKPAQVRGTEGLFVPCQCPEARKVQDREHWIEMERRKQLSRRGKKK